jgi:hypothetical protein
VSVLSSVSTGVKILFRFSAVIGYFSGSAIVNITCFVSETDTAFAHGSQAPKQQQSRDPLPLRIEIVFIPLFSPGGNFHS